MISLMKLSSVHVLQSFPLNILAIEMEFLLADYILLEAISHFIFYPNTYLLFISYVKNKRLKK